MHTPPTAGIWTGNSWIYTSYISVVTIQPVIILMRLHKQKQCLMAHFQYRFHTSDFKQIVFEFLFYTTGKIAKNLFGVGTWHPTVICSFRCTTTDCLQYISQNFWQTVSELRLKFLKLATNLVISLVYIVVNQIVNFETNLWISGWICLEVAKFLCHSV